MEVKEIINNLRYNKTGKFQEESVLEARKHKEEVTRELLRELEEIANNTEKYAKDKEYFLPLYALYLLAEFREKRAFPIIIKLITGNQDAVNELMGDLITEDLKNILASTFDGNIDCLYNIITNLELDEYIRNAVFQSLDILREYNIIENEQIIKMIDKMLSNELKNDYSIVITSIVVYIIENQIYDKVNLVRELYNEGKVNSQMIGDYDQFIDDIYGKKEHHSDKNMIEDTVKSLSRWACFNENEDTSKDIWEGIKDFIKEQKKNEKIELDKRKKIGRNDLCYCGSGKKYKKCCMAKDELIVHTPADFYIERELKKYPKEELLKLYDKEIVEIDEKIYQVLKHKAIPMWINRNYAEEARRNTKNMKEALELIRIKCQKENIKTVEEFDEKIAIHYTFSEIIVKYFNVIDSTQGGYFEDLQNQKVDFLLEILQMIYVDTESKILFINEIIKEYLEDDEILDDVKEVINRFKEEFPEIKEAMNLEMINVYIKDGYELEEALEIIDKHEKEFGISEDIEKKRIELYYEYAMQEYYNENEIKQLEFCRKLWQLVKDFITKYKIKNEYEYNAKQEAEYCFYNVLSRMEDLYGLNKEYAKEKEKYLNEALEILELEEDSRQIVIEGLTKTYCDMDKENEAIKIIDEFLKEFPNNTNAIIAKSNIYINKENAEFQKAINILENALNNNQKFDTYLIYSKLALLNEEVGNEEKANEYQKLAMQDEELPF